MELHGSGAWDAGFDVDAAASLAGAALTGRGRFAPKAQGDEARLFGALKVAGDNVAPLAALFGVATAGGAIGPVEASADVTLRGERWTASRIAATVAGVKASGALAYEAPAAPGETVASPDLRARRGGGRRPRRRCRRRRRHRRGVVRPPAPRRPRGAGARPAATRRRGQGRGRRRNSPPRRSPCPPPPCASTSGR